MFVSADEDDNGIDLNQSNSNTKTEENHEEPVNNNNNNNDNYYNNHTNDTSQKQNNFSLLGKERKAPDIPLPVETKDLGLDHFLKTLPKKPIQKSQHTLFYKKTPDKKDNVQFHQVDASGYYTELSQQGNQSNQSETPYNSIHSTIQEQKHNKNRKRKNKLSWDGNIGDMVSLTHSEYTQHRKRPRRNYHERPRTTKDEIHKVYLKKRERIRSQRSTRANKSITSSFSNSEHGATEFDLDDGWMGSPSAKSSNSKQSDPTPVVVYSEERWQETADIFDAYNCLMDLLEPTMPTELNVCHMKDWSDQVEKVASVDPLIVRITFGEACRNVMRSTDLEKLARFQNLMGLKLSNCECTDQAFNALVSLIKLEYLEIDSCPRITDASMNTIRNMKNLCHLKLNNNPLITDNGIKTLVSPKEESSVSSTSLSLSSDSSDVLSPLCSIELSTCSFNMTNRAISMLTELPYLVRLHLYSCNNISNPALPQLSERTPYLRSLGISKCFNITACELKKAIYRMPFIEELDVSHLSIIDDDFFQEDSQLLQSVKRPPESGNFMLENLKDLNISGTQIGDTGLSYIISNCTQLERLTMTWCSKVTRQGIKFLNKSRSLQLIDARDNPGIEKHLNDLHMRNDDLIVKCSSREN